jgi:thioesterase domain-containing protein/acyl carrier protein
VKPSNTRLAPDTPVIDSRVTSPTSAQTCDFESPRFNVLHVVNVRGLLDLDVLERRLLELRRAYPSLQNCFELNGNLAKSLNNPEEPEPVRFLDLEGLHATAQKFSFTATLEELLNTKLNPQEGRLLRTYVVRRNKEDHCVMFLAHAFVADARSLRHLSEQLIEMYREDLPASSFATAERRDSENSGEDRSYPKSTSYPLPGRTELKGSISLASPGAPEEGRDNLLALATAAFISHNERNPLLRPVRIRAVFPGDEIPRFNKLVGAVLSNYGFGPQAPLQRLVALDSADNQAKLIEKVSSGNGVKATVLKVALQEVVPGFSMSIGSLQFTGGEIRNPLCDSDISVYLDQQGSLVRIFLNIDTELLNETAMRFWLEGYEDSLSRIVAEGVAKIGENENRLTLQEDEEQTPALLLGSESAISAGENNVTLEGGTIVSNASSETLVAPSTQTERKLVRIWADVLKLERIGVNENFFDLGGHSLLAVALFSQITNEFGVELSLNSLLEHGTIRALAPLLEGPQPFVDTECRLIPLQGNVTGDRPPLFWIPGGRAISVLAFHEVSASMGPDQPVYGLESRLPVPGEPVLSVPLRAARYINLIRSIQPKGPYFLAGFCMGGMVAFEMAQQLISQGEKVALLALVQASMPGFPASRFQRFRLSSQHQWFLCKTLLRFLATRYASKIVGISRERKQQVLDEMSKLILGWHGTSAQLPDETQATNTQIMYAYRPKPYGGNIHIILAEDCYESSGISQSLDPRRAWSRITEGKCVTHVLPGDHHSILVNANASRLAQRMRSLLDETAKDAEGA